MIDALIQSAVLFALVALATRLLKRRAPAAFRHMLWAFAIVAALAAPVIARISPLEIQVLPASSLITRSAPANVAQPVPGEAASRK
jgi:beta-lactamase regulating signal transducer with metallopeptidase domain